MDRQSEIRRVQQVVGGLGPRPAISQILTPRLSLPLEEFALEDAIIIIADRESMAGHTIVAGTSGKIKQVHGEYVQVDLIVIQSCARSTAQVFLSCVASLTSSEAIYAWTKYGPTHLGSRAIGKCSGLGFCKS